MDVGGFLSAVQEQPLVDPQGKSYSQHLARPVVDFVVDGVQLFLAVAHSMGCSSKVNEIRQFDNQCPQEETRENTQNKTKPLS